MQQSTALKSLAALGVLAAGVAIGAAAERVVARRIAPRGPDSGRSDGSEGHWISVDDGTRIYVEVDDGPDDDAPTVIFSHGYALSLDAWPQQRDRIARVARVVMWDQRGHGRSGRGPAGADIERLGRDLGGVIDSVMSGRPDDPVILVGHSMGGMTIMALAGQRPELFGTRVRGVALLATSAGGIADVDLGLPRPVARLAHRVAPAIGAGLGPGRPASALLERARRSSGDLGLLITRAYAFGSSAPPGGTRLVSDLIAGTPIDVLADLLPALQSHDQHAALAALVDTDLLVMVGDADLLTPLGHSIEIVRRVPGAELVVLPGVGHMLTLEAGDEVTDHLLALVERVAEQ